MNFAVTRVRLAEIFFGVGLALVMAAAVWIAREFLGPADAPIPLPPEIRATVLDEPLAVPEFQLIDQNGERYSRADLVGRWSILFFGYTHCPDICPTTMSTLVQMESRLRQLAGQGRPRFVFVSVDPERDSSEHLAQYTNYFHPEFLGVTGADRQLRSLTAPLGIHYQMDPPDSNGSYAVRHSSAVLIVGPDANLRALMSPPHDAVVMASDYLQILER